MNRPDKTESAIFISLFWFGCSRRIDFLPEFLCVFQLRKAYFQQAQEIKALKEQLALKDKRIRQLEDEANLLKKSGADESNC